MEGSWVIFCSLSFLLLGISSKEDLELQKYPEVGQLVGSWKLLGITLGETPVMSGLKKTLMIPTTPPRSSMISKNRSEYE